MTRLSQQPWFQWSIVPLVVFAGIGVLYYSGLLRLNFPPPDRFPIRGIDVSHHQKIRWFTVSLQEIRFAYIKATEGTDYRDRDFLTNWELCRQNGLQCGAYHFFNFCTSGKEQAANFLKVVPQEPGALPPALDLERSGNCRRSVSRAEVIREVSSFVQVISRRYSAKPVFYITPDFYKRYYKGHEKEFPAHLLWIRNVVAEPKVEGWVFWQYAATGRVDGIRGPVDLNVFHGTAAQYDAFSVIKTQK